MAPGRVDFLGNVPDVRPLLHASDVLLLTSDSEGVPGVLIEAGLCALPVVTREVGYVRDVVSDGVTGLLVDSDVPADFGPALSSAIARNDELGSAARRWCLDRFDTRLVVDEWSNLIARVRAESDVRAAPPRRGSAM